MINIPTSEKILTGYKFIDLFAGIGGFHYALKSFGAECVFASELEKNTADIYKINHSLDALGNITKTATESIPKHDILCAGFPCQAFSISGKQKGFEDTRGTLFFDISRIVKYHKPQIVFLENVKNFEKHDNGKTLQVVKNTLVEMGYSVFYKVLNTSDFGLPQNRERIYIIAFNKKYFPNPIFRFPNEKTTTKLQDFLEQKPKTNKFIERNDIVFYKIFTPKTNLFGKIEYPNKPIQIGKVSKGRQGERIYDVRGHSITLSAYGGGIGAKTGLYKIGDKIRKLTPRECARIQGFPEDFILPESVSQAHKFFGNSVSINVLQYILKEIGQTIIKNEQRTTIGFKDSKSWFSERERNSREIQSVANRYGS